MVAYRTMRGAISYLIFHFQWLNDDPAFTSGIFSDFGIMPPLVSVVKILKIGVTWKIWDKAGVKLLRDLTEKSVNFSILATSNIRLLLFLGEEDQ